AEQNARNHLTDDLWLAEAAEYSAQASRREHDRQQREEDVEQQRRLRNRSRPEPGHAGCGFRRGQVPAEEEDRTDADGGCDPEEREEQPRASRSVDEPIVGKLNGCACASRIRPGYLAHENPSCHQHDGASKICLHDRLYPRGCTHSNTSSSTDISPG